MEAYELARTNMVKSQILTQKINNEALVEVINTIPRHIFVPEDRQGIAYIDQSIQVGHGRYILPPMVFAKMVEALDIKGAESVLDIACGTGYSSVIFANLCKKVVAVESNTDLASKAHLNLNKLAVRNVIIISDTLADGHEEAAPYEVVFINGAVKEIPQRILSQLAEGGKLVSIISKARNSGAITLFSKINGAVVGTEIFDVNLPVIEDF